VVGLGLDGRTVNWFKRCRAQADLLELRRRSCTALRASSGSRHAYWQQMACGACMLRALERIILAACGRRDSPAAASFALLHWLTLWNLSNILYRCGVRGGMPLPIAVPAAWARRCVRVAALQGGDAEEGGCSSADCSTAP